jgi:hypothetical protein
MEKGRGGSFLKLVSQTKHRRLNVPNHFKIPVRVSKRILELDAINNPGKSISGDTSPYWLSFEHREYCLNSPKYFYPGKDRLKTRQNKKIYSYWGSLFLSRHSLNKKPVFVYNILLKVAFTNYRYTCSLLMSGVAMVHILNCFHRAEFIVIGRVLLPHPDWEKD